MGNVSFPASHLKPPKPAKPTKPGGNGGGKPNLPPLSFEGNKGKGAPRPPKTGFRNQ